ncbi:Crotonobetainyl-CoA:carnitine CoA-transferase CaiB [Pseudonocardia ammonioxydans]|uniref:Crotonobetainyl-CoA:carnitine CoA-transferase CaiB n=1 Tax=Pseudonocardia ammonioxydans TaxID=260086 RepID=A0A1I4WX92_PSUAM|nr:Crotonobetainyl-CoA:carnitine CoA-transferase CaiB [Pseudonocardia ammonioxydans]
MDRGSAAPLHGVRVVSLAVNVPGPVAAARLADLGADVVKVEPPAGDALQVAAAGWYRELTARHEVVTLDLRDAADRERLEERLATADVLLTAMRPAALDRLGLRASVGRHRLVHVEIVGYDGERAGEAGHDLTYQAAHGTLQPPAVPTVPVADLLGGERAALAAVAGLRLRDRSGDAVHQPVVLDHVARDAAAGVRHGLTGPGDVLGGASPGYGIYPTTDGYVAVGAVEPHFVARLGDAVGRTRAELAARFATADSKHWQELGNELDIPIVAVGSIVDDDTLQEMR